MDQLIGGFAVVAYPAKYGVSGVMTFIVNHDGTVFPEKPGQDHRDCSARDEPLQPGQELAESRVGCPLDRNQ
jgi:hypothetical protein